MYSKKHTIYRHILLFFGIFFLLYPLRNAFAFQVDPLPADNLIQNPWFRSAADPASAGFDSWVNVDNHWTLSQKLSNPASDAFYTGICGTTEPTYCGTAAKLAADDGNATVGIDSYLYQVVSADPTHTKLKFFVHWVAHYVEPFEVNVYGGSQTTGPWTLLWTPLHQVEVSFLQPPPGEDTSWLWKEMTTRTPQVETVLPAGHPFYKVEIRAKLPQPEGFKLTGVYFATEPLVVIPTETPTASPTPTATGRLGSTPTASPTPSSRLGGSPTPTATKTPTSAVFPTNTPTPTAFTSYTATPTLIASKTPTPTAFLSKTPTPILIASSTPTLSLTPTQAVTPAADVIFSDSFESGTFSSWSASVTDSNDLIVSTGAGMFGNYGMHAVFDDTNAMYVTDLSPAAEPRYRARFYFDPNSISMMDKSAHYIFEAYSGTSSVVMRVELQKSRGSYQLRAGLANDNNTWKNSSFFTVTDNLHYVEVDWKASTTNGANNGSLIFWIDGQQKAYLTAVDNDTHRIDQVRLGAVSGIDSGTSGSSCFDAFESHRTTYIGPASK